MDFGILGLDGFGSSDIGFGSDQEAKHKLYGSGFHNKQERSGTVDQEGCWRSAKQSRTDDFSASKATTLQLNNGLQRTDSTHFSDGQQLLSFSSSPNSQAQNAALPSYFQQAMFAYNRNSGTFTNLVLVIFVFKNKKNHVGICM